MASHDDRPTLITPAMRAWVGLNDPAARLSGYLRERHPPRRHLNLLAGSSPRVYWDQEHAARTRWRGIIAPEEFNPFAWMIGRAHVGPQPERLDDEQEALENARVLRPPGAPPNFLFGGIESTYHERMRPGDIVTSIMTATELYERAGRLGPMLFFIIEENWTNQSGDLIKATRSTNIQW